MRISIVVAVYNGASTLQACIDSIKEQTYKNRELIIIDGGSSDGTFDIIKENNDLITHWESKPDHGIYHAWNKALKHVNGDWVCFLGADDYFWAADVLEKFSVALIDASPSYRVVYGQVAVVNKNNEVLCYAGESWSLARRKFRQLMSLPHQGVMHHSSLFDKYGGFDEEFMIAGDYEFLLRELRDHDALFVPDIIMTGMQLGGMSSDPSGSLKLLREIRQAHQKLLDGECGWYWRFAYIKVWARKLLWFFLGKSTTRRLLDFFRICVGKSRHWTRI